jgi:nucleotide-binding universal stress UspA family protein
MKKILVPTDFSDHAINATKIAAGIAIKNKASVNFLHVVESQFIGNSELLDIIYKGIFFNNLF